MIQYLIIMQSSIGKQVWSSGHFKSREMAEKEANLFRSKGYEIIAIIPGSIVDKY